MLDDSQQRSRSAASHGRLERCICTQCRTPATPLGVMVPHYTKEKHERDDRRRQSAYGKRGLSRGRGVVGSTTSDVRGRGRGRGVPGRRAGRFAGFTRGLRVAGSGRGRVGLDVGEAPPASGSIVTADEVSVNEGLGWAGDCGDDFPMDVDPPEPPIIPSSVSNDELMAKPPGSTTPASSTPQLGPQEQLPEAESIETSNTGSQLNSQNSTSSSPTTSLTSSRPEQDMSRLLLLKTSQPDQNGSPFSPGRKTDIPPQSSFTQPIVNRDAQTPSSSFDPPRQSRLSTIGAQSIYATQVGLPGASAGIDSTRTPENASFPGTSEGLENAILSTHPAEPRRATSRTTPSPSFPHSFTQQRPTDRSSILGQQSLRSVPNLDHFSRLPDQELSHLLPNENPSLRHRYTAETAQDQYGILNNACHNSTQAQRQPANQNIQSQSLSALQPQDCSQQELLQGSPGLGGRHEGFIEPDESQRATNRIATSTSTAEPLTAASVSTTETVGPSSEAQNAPSMQPRRSTRQRKPKQREEVVSLVERAALERAAQARALEAVVPPDGFATTIQDPDDLASAFAEAEVTPPNELANGGDGEASQRDSEQDNDVLEPPSSFPLAEPRRPLYDIYIDSHTEWFARLGLLVTAFLHTRQNVSFRSCAIILALLNSILLALGVVSFENQIPTSLDTVLRRLELEDRFKIYPICKACHRIFQPQIPISSHCPDCDKELFRSISNSIFRSITGCNAPPPPPLLVTPIQVPSSLLVDFLCRPGMENVTETYNKTRIRRKNVKTDISDGAIWEEAKCPDGTKFFDDNDESGELRIGITMSLDWFGPSTSAYGPSHSSGCLSFCVANLPPSLRYQVDNLLVALMTPGPSEPDAEQMQHYLRIIVDDLLQLYHGVRIPTPSCPEGRLVRVYLLAIIADHPAMCKLGGFADHGHSAWPCPKCNVSQAELRTNKSLRNEFTRRDGEEFRAKSFAWKALATKTEQGIFFDREGVRWSELARLTYFNIVRQSIVDPMHNLLLGVVKTQWYANWIKSGSLRASTTTRARELDVIHQFLENFEAPYWAGKLPARMGEPAGGSLSADEYKFATIIALPLVIPVVWDRYQSEAAEDLEKAQNRYIKALEEHEKELARWREDELARKAEEEKAPDGTKKKQKTSRKPAPLPPNVPRSRLQDGEVLNFLRLATALKIFLGTSISEEGITRAESLFIDYLTSLDDFYGMEAIKPNHHWAVHLPDQLRDFGPVYGFWTFLGERLNKLLKTFNNNSRKGGQLEVSMMRSFGRDVYLRSMIREISLRNLESAHEVELTICGRLLNESAEARGTVQDAANHEYSANDRFRLNTGPLVNQMDALPGNIQRALVDHYGASRVHFPLDRMPFPFSKMLTQRAQFYEYIILDGRRITPISRTRRTTAGSSIVSAVWNNEDHVGELVSIFNHAQEGMPEPVLFAEMRWLVESDTSATEDDPWDNFPELGVRVWEYGRYREDNEGPPRIVPCNSITGQVARGVIDTTVPRLWITTTMHRQSILIS